MKSLARAWMVAGSLLLVGASTARAEGFTFDLGDATLLPGTGQRLVNAFYPQATQAGLGPQLGAELELTLAPRVAQLSAEVRQEVENVLRPLNFSNFLHNSANASALAAKAMPVDYASAFRLFSLSIGGGGAIGGTQYKSELRHAGRTIDSLSNSQAPNVGGAASLGISLGINLGAFKVPHGRYFDMRKLQLFVSAFALPLGHDDGSWSVRTSTFGGYLKYPLLRDRIVGNKRLLHWHGLNVITGLGYSAMRLRVNASLPGSNVTQQVTVQGNTLNVNAAWTGDAQVGAHTRVFTIPIEVASAVQLLYALTLYGGAAVDFNIGRAQLSADARAPVNVTATKAGAGQSVLLSQPTPTLNYDLSRNATTVDVRGFAGLQVNAGVAALFVQVSGDTTRSAGVHGGLRGFW